MLLALTRGLFVAGLLSGFGAALFTAFAVQGAARALTARQSRAIVRASLGLALVAGLVWLALQTSIMAETDSVAATAAQDSDRPVRYAVRPGVAAASRGRRGGLRPGASR